MRLSMAVVTKVAWMATIFALLTPRLVTGQPADPPTNVIVAVSGPTLDIRWNAPASGPPELRYALNFYSGDNLVASVNVNPLVTSATLAIPPGTAGDFTVAVVNVRQGIVGPIGVASERVPFTVGTTGCSGPPSPPTGVVGFRMLRTANVRWNPSPGATSYGVQAGTLLGSSNLFNGNVGNLTTVGGNDIDPAIPLFVRVFAANACGVSAPTTDIVVDPSGALTCVPNERTMCLFDGRFTVTLNAQVPGGTPTPALVTRRFNDGGGFSFTSTSGENVFVRILDRCAVSGAYQLAFNAGSGGIPVTTAFDLFIGDNQGSIARTYTHPGGTSFVSFSDGQSFNRCP